jgi:hypothetical protein
LAGRFIAWALNALSRLGENFRAGISLAFEAFRVAFTRRLATVGPGIISRFVTFLRELPKAVGKMFDDFATAFTSGFSRFTRFLGDLIGRVVIKFREFVGLLLKPFKDLGNNIKDDMFMIGKNAIDALIRGFKAVVPRLTEGVKNVGRTVVDTVSKLWKIDSPSKVFMGIGKDAMQGLALGLAGSERMLRDLSTGVGNAALPSIDVAGAGSLGGQTVINVTVTAADPQAVVEALRRYVRANGPLGQVVSV